MPPPALVILRATPIRPDPRVEKIGRALQRAGLTVRALGWERASTQPARDQDAGFPIERLVLPAAWRRGLGNLPALARWQAALFNWLRTHRAEILAIHACDFDTVLPALWAKRLWGLRVVYDIFDFYADMLRATPSFIRRLVGAADRLAIGEADAVILADEARRQQIFGSRPRRLEVIVNSPEDLLSSLQSTGEPRPDPAVRLRLAYCGLLQVERGLLPLLEVVARNPAWHLDLAGEGAERGLILNEARRLQNVTYHGVVPYRQALELNYTADILPALYDPAIPNHRYASPNKLFEAMMLGCPVLAARQTGFDRLVESQDCGRVVDYDNVEEIERTLREMEDAGLRARLGANGRKAYEESYAWERMADCLVRLYQEVLR